MRLALALLLAATPLARAVESGATPDLARDRALATIERLGGTHDTSDGATASPVVMVDLHETAVTDADLAIIAGGLPDLEELDLRWTGIGDAGVAQLAGLKRLAKLNVFRTRVTDRGLASLRPVTTLRTLMLGGTAVTDAGMPHLAAFPALRKLSLFGTAVTDAGLRHLHALPRLEVALLGKTATTEHGLRALRAARPALRLAEGA